jgi:putative endonuclease
MWHVYILQCSDKTFYTGMTTDLQKRIYDHNNSSLGARYTRCRRPSKLVYSQKQKDRAEAAKEEYRIKKLSKKKKMELINGQ